MILCRAQGAFDVSTNAVRMNDASVPLGAPGAKYAAIRPSLPRFLLPRHSAYGKLKRRVQFTGSLGLVFA